MLSLPKLQNVKSCEHIEFRISVRNSESWYIRAEIKQALLDWLPLKKDFFKKERPRGRIEVAFRVNRCDLQLRKVRELTKKNPW